LIARDSRNPTILGVFANDEKRFTVAFGEAITIASTSLRHRVSIAMACRRQMKQRQMMGERPDRTGKHEAAVSIPQPAPTVASTIEGTRASVNTSEPRFQPDNRSGEIAG
jgi:hypothetical protein